MARQRGPRFKVARRFGVNVCGHPKALKRGPKPTKKMSEYGKQLLEKQKLKAYYDVLEKQFTKYVEDALKSQENPGEKLIWRLEMRLDNIAYRLGFGSSIRQARQIVNHGHLLVNGKKVDIPSYKVSVGDTITLREKSRSTQLFKDNFAASNVTLPYLQKDIDNYSGKVVSLPNREDVPIEITESLIVEFYSK